MCGKKMNVCIKNYNPLNSFFLNFLLFLLHLKRIELPNLMGITTKCFFSVALWIPFNLLYYLGKRYANETVLSDGMHIFTVELS